jgi:hypothetical protein
MPFSAQCVGDGNGALVQIIQFLEGEIPDLRGRFLADIWRFSDLEIEDVHDFIQWIFPLDEKSFFNPSAPLLELDDIKSIRRSPKAADGVEKSAARYMQFLQDNVHWMASEDHNHLRITRVIKCLRLLVGDHEANRFREDVFELLETSGGNISEITRRFWVDA